VSDDRLAALVVALRRLQRVAGEPSARAIAKSINYSHTAVSEAFRGNQLPRWEIVQKIVVHLNGDVEEVRQLWILVRDVQEPLACEYPADGNRAAEPERESADAGAPVPEDGGRGEQIPPVLARWRTTDGARSDTWDFFDPDLAMKVIREQMIKAQEFGLEGGDQRGQSR
jgi:hypothetical protein